MFFLRYVSYNISLLVPQITPQVIVPDEQPQHAQIEIAPQIFVPDEQPGTSNQCSINLWDDGINEMEMVKAVDNYEKNEEKLRKTKRMRMSTTTSGFREVASAFNGMCKNFFKKNVENIKDYDTFLEFSKSSIRDLLYNKVPHKI